MPHNTLVLFDIDGTLVDVHGAGRRSFARAFKHAWGIDDDLSHVRFAGATDRGVLAQLAARHGLSEDHERHEADFFLAMARALEDELTREAATACRDAAAVVEALAGRGGVALGLVTGNARATAMIKLAAVDLAGAFLAHGDGQQAIGGFGDEHHDRRVLARLATERGAPTGASAVRVVLVGDTANDIDAALAIGAVAVGVCTGHTSADVLHSAGAHLVVDTLADPAFWATVVS